MNFLTSGSHTCNTSTENSVLDYGYTSKQKQFMLNNISLNPTTLAVKMTDNNIIPLLKLPIMVQKIKDFKAYNKLKLQNVGE